MIITGISKTTAIKTGLHKLFNFLISRILHIDIIKLALKEINKYS